MPGAHDGQGTHHRMHGPLALTHSLPLNRRRVGRPSSSPPLSLPLFQSQAGRSALILATMVGPGGVAIATKLLDCGADPNLKMKVCVYVEGC